MQSLAFLQTGPHPELTVAAAVLVLLVIVIISLIVLVVIWKQVLLESFGTPSLLACLSILLLIFHFSAICGYSSKPKYVNMRFKYCASGFAALPVQRCSYYVLL